VNPSATILTSTPLSRPRLTVHGAWR
jgi:hypothetical protein